MKSVSDHQEHSSSSPEHRREHTSASLPIGAGGGFTMDRKTWMFAKVVIGILYPIIWLGEHRQRALLVISLASFLAGGLLAKAMGAATMIPIDQRRDAVCARLGKPNDCVLDRVYHQRRRAEIVADDSGPSFLAVRIRGINEQLVWTPIPPGLGEVSGWVTEDRLLNPATFTSVLQYYVGSPELQDEALARLGFTSGGPYVLYASANQNFRIKVRADSRGAPGATKIETLLDIYVVQ